MTFQFCLNNFCCKISIYILPNCPGHYHIQENNFHLYIHFVGLSTRFDNEVAINLALLINFILSDIVRTLSLQSLSIFITPVSFETEKVLYFPVFSLRPSNFPSNLFANYLITK